MNADAEPRLQRRLVYSLYALSGFISLGYQVGWFRIFVDEFGANSLTFTLVVLNFIGGLGAGALAGSRVSRWVARRTGAGNPLRVYGIVEAAIVAAAALTFAAKLMPHGAWGAFPYRLDGTIYFPAGGYAYARVAVAAAVVFVPCFFMGITFPLLCEAFQEDGKFPSALYAWNTLGACAALIACEFALIPLLGHTGMFALMMAANGTLAAFFLVSPLAARGGPGLLAPPPKAGTPAKAEPAGERFELSAALACAALSGFLGGALEGDMFHRVSFSGHPFSIAMSFVSFWAIFAIFAASWAVRAIPKLGFRAIKGAYVAALVVYFLVARFIYPIRESIGSIQAQFPSNAARAGEGAWAVASGMLSLLFFVGVVVFPTYALISLLLPYACNRLQGGKRHLGLAYGINTLAFCAGMVAFTRLATRVNIFYAIKLAIPVFAAGVVLLAVLNPARKLAAWQPALALGLLSLAAIATPRGFDRSMLGPGSAVASFPISSLKSDGTHTTYVVDKALVKSLFFDSHSMSSTALGDQRYMRLMAHFPLLAHPRPESALLICFGVGNTASAIALHDTIRRIDIVDLNPRVLETAHEFQADNRRVYEDPRVRMIADDGRNFLGLEGPLYDLVTSEPPPPMKEGIDRLYSREYYEAIKRRLTPNGLMTQWLPLEEMPREAEERVVSTFVNAFPDSLLFVGHDDHYILMGSKSKIDLACALRRFNEAAAPREELVKYGIASPALMAARIVAGRESLMKEYGAARQISDSRNDLAHLIFSPNPPVVIHDPEAVIREIGAEALGVAAEIRRVSADATTMRAALPGFAGLRLRRAGTGALAGAEGWRQADELNLAAAKAMNAGDLQGGIATFEKSLALVPEQFDVLLFVADARERLGDLEGAVAGWRRFSAAKPGDARGRFEAGRILLQLRRFEDAAGEFKLLTEMQPTWPHAHKVLGDCHASLGRFAEAVACYTRALALDPGYAAAAQNKAEAERRLQAAPAAGSR